MSTRIVFTGFEPFLEYDYNPSWDIASAAADELGAQAHELPVGFEAARRAHEVLVDDGMPGILVHVGLAARYEFVKFERFAHNVLGGRDDVEQTRDGHDALVDGSDLALQTRLHLGPLVERFNEMSSAEGPPAEISRDAGTFVCNAAYYHSLLAFRDSPVDVLFVHVPMVDPDAAKVLGRNLARALSPQVSR